jgi:hypothetical protein
LRTSREITVHHAFDLFKISQSVGSRVTSTNGLRGQALAVMFKILLKIVHAL